MAVVLIAVIANWGDPKSSGRAATAGVTLTSAPAVTTTDPAVAASVSSAAEAARESVSRSFAESASRSSESERKSSEAVVTQRKADEEAALKARKITYSVTTTGVGISSVTYMKPGFNISQETNVRGKKWSKTVDAEGDTLGINMNAQNAGGGTISCRISRGEGTVISENSSSGAYAVVSCG
ncbi:MmpS family transport accessory protein [Amycolatopsis sp. cmx-11-12]|uniref:MmpS family transport accessory protein n=1 Tax=Amycolatopsis sp. cmx-11-12 TaxID=2785795 RepID=UPI003916DDEB